MSEETQAADLPRRQCRICGALLRTADEHLCGGTPTQYFNNAALGIQQLWNGPTCAVCGTPYLGTHECDPRVLRLKADQLNDLANEIEARRIQEQR